jgi:hypothetical protein
MTLMDAQQYDEARDRRRRKIIIIAVIVAMVLAWVGYHLRDYPQRRVAGKFFSALQRGDIEGAYAIWMQDPNWKQHPKKYSNYTFGDFSQDWGPSGQWGIIKSHKVNCSYAAGNGVIVEVTPNQRAEHATIWVDKADKTLHFSPSEIDCGNWWGWLTE